jgi:hypothetical protein
MESILTPELKRHLDEHGYVVVPNVLTAAECDATVDGMWQWLDTFSEGQVKRNDPATWKRHWPYTHGPKGIIQWYSIGHAPFVWDVRQHPRVHRVFTEVWGPASPASPASPGQDQDLLVSFDGVCIQRPPEQLRAGSHSAPLSDTWQHADKGKTKMDQLSVQSFVNLEETDEGDGCLVVRPGSHKLHKLFLETFGDDFDRSDWLLLEQKHRDWYDAQGCPAKRVAAPKGAMVLWRSETIHCNSTAQPGRAHPERFRYVVYVCMAPRSLASAATLRKKQLYFEQGRMTSHYPHQLKVFPKRPFLHGNHSYDAGFERMEQLYRPPTLTAHGRRLAGYDA